MGLKDCRLDILVLKEENNMCVGAPVQQLMGWKPAANFVNNTPVGYLYQGVINNKLSDDIKTGQAYAGLAGSKLIQDQKKVGNQFSTAG